MCEQLIQEGRAQFLLCPHHDAAPVRLDPTRFLSIRVGTDKLHLVTAPFQYGMSLFVLRKGNPNVVPYHAYTEQSGLGRIVAEARPDLCAEVAARRYEQH